MWKCSGILVAGSLFLGPAALGREPRVSLAVDPADSPHALLGVVPDVQPLQGAASRPAEAPNRLSIAPPPGMSFDWSLDGPDGNNRITVIDPAVCDLRANLPRWLAGPVERMRSAITGDEDPFAALGNIFDVQDMERPWSVTTSIRLQAKTDEGLNRWVPFATVAREVAAVEDKERLGMGGGMSYHIAGDTSFYTEVLYFGDRMNSGNAWDRETRFTMGFQFTF